MTPLLEILDSKVLPWARQLSPARLIVAQTAMDKAALPPGVELMPEKLLGRRVASRGPRRYGNANIVAATWPDDHLLELKAAKLLCVVSGDADLRIGEHFVYCPEGTFVLIPAGVPHDDGSRCHFAEGRTDGRSCDLMWLQPWGRGLQCKLCHSRGKRHRHQGPGEDGFILDEAANGILDLLAEESLRDTGSACLSLLLAFVQVVENALRHENLRRDDMVAAIAATDGKARGSMEEAQQYIRTHLNQKLTIEKVAQKVYMSRTQFAVRFRKETGLSFVECVTQYRMDEARSLLRDTDWCISRIGHYVGLRSASYFNKLLLRSEGMTPGEYRERNRQGGSSKPSEQGKI